MNRRHRVALLTVVSLVGMSLAVPTAGATPSEDTLQRAFAAVEIGKAKAKGFAAEAAGEENHTRGLDRAAEAIAAAAERKATRDGAAVTTENPGRGLGRGHSAEVHAILAEVHAILLDGGSPSDLPPHGETVRELAHAYDTVKADHPGLKLGHAKNGKAAAED